MIKIVNLQKSQWSNLFYINYGFDFRDLDYDAVMMHIYRGIGTKDAAGNNILDFEKDFPGNRVVAIENLLTNLLLDAFSNCNSVADIIEDLNQKSHPNNVTFKVKEFLGLI